MRFLNINETKEFLRDYIENLNEEIKFFLNEILKKNKFYVNNEVLYYMSYETYEIYQKYMDCSLDSIMSFDNYRLFKISFNDGIKLEIHKAQLRKRENNVYFRYITDYGSICITNETKLYWIKFIRGKYSKIPLDSISSFHKYCNLEKDLEKYIINNFFIKNKYLEKDLKYEDYILLDKKIEDYSKFKTKKQLLEYIFNEEIQYNLNKIPFYLGYSIMKLKKYISRKDFENLYKFCLKYKNDEYSLINIKNNGYLYDIVGKYYEIVNNININFNDYINDIFKIKTIKININKKSYNKLEKEIKDISNFCILKFSRKRLIVPEKIKKLKFPYNFKLIKKSEDLFNEAIKQNNCLWELYYYNLIQYENKIAIFSITDKDNKMYTLSLRINKKKNIVIVDFKGFNNSIPPYYLIKDINNILKEFNFKSNNIGVKS